MGRHKTRYSRKHGKTGAFDRKQKRRVGQGAAYIERAREHAQRRLLSRYGILWTKAEIRAFERELFATDHQFAEANWMKYLERRNADGSRVYLAKRRADGLQLRVVLDRKLGVIRTFLPLEGPKEGHPVQMISVQV